MTQPHPLTPLRHFLMLLLMHLQLTLRSAKEHEKLVNLATRALEAYGEVDDGVTRE